MFASHYGPHRLSLDRHGSFAFWSKTAPKGVVVFVHGFRGQPMPAWTPLLSKLMSTGSMQERDVLLFGYGSAYTRVANIAIRLRELISQLIQGQSHHVPRRVLLERGGHTNYTSLAFVAHSMGAVVVRRALLDAAKLNGWNPWNAEFCLIAPAHMGADAARLAATTITALTLPIGGAVRALYPCLFDLDPGSVTLADLLQDTVELHQKTGFPSKAASVLWAEFDSIVQPRSFYKDPFPVQVNLTTHAGILKDSASLNVVVREARKCL